MRNRVFGGMLLITGSCIGAGMLGLPVLTGLAGFYPALAMFAVAWIFMTTTGLFLIEANSWFKKPVNLLSMMEHTLGKWARYLSWILYLFLFYALLVVYMILSGNHVSNFFSGVFGLSVPNWATTMLFVILFGGLIYFGTRPVDLMNRTLMFVKVIAFLGLIAVGAGYISVENLEIAQPKLMIVALPILVISFGFHNMIPSLFTYLKGDVKKIKQAVVGGALLTLVIYLIWEIIALGILPYDSIEPAWRSDTDAAELIQNIVERPAIGIFASFLAFFAILTSFLAQALGLAHFWGDGLGAKDTKGANFWYCGMALLPPLGFSILFPDAFFKAIDFAGGVCAVILFGLLPVLVVWKGRKTKRDGYCVRGGKPLLIVIFLVAAFILSYQVCSMLGLNFVL